MIGVLKAVIAWITLMLVGTNLIGFVVRGLLWIPPHIDADAPKSVRHILADEVRRYSVANIAITIFWTLLSLAYIGALYHFWNILLASAGILEMCSRLPDLLWEIRHGKRLTKGDAPSGAIYKFATTLSFICLQDNPQF